MKRSVIVRIWVVVVAALAVVGYGGYRGYAYLNQRKKTQRDNPAVSAPLKVIAQPITTADLEWTVQLTGTTEPAASVDVVSKVGGRLRQFRLSDGKPVEEGLVVKADEVIAVIEHEDLSQAVKQADAALEVAKANAAHARVNAQDAEREKTRLKTLYDEHAVTQQQWDKVCVASERASAEVALAEAQIRQAEAAVEAARIRLSDATIKSPISGVISKKFVDEGDMVGPTTPIIRVVQVDTVKVVGAVSERYLARLRPRSTPARLVLDAYPEKKFEGIVERIGVAVDPLTRSAEVEIRVPNPDGTIKPGMFARVTLVLERKQKATVVNDAALLYQEDEVRVFRVEDAVAHRQALKLGLWEGELHEVLEGLKPGDVVVVRGQHLLKDGDKVEVVAEGAK
jgi:RND family efflux transporter MFP subunit